MCNDLVTELTQTCTRERERGKKCYDVEIVCIVFGMGMTKSWHTAHQKGTYIFDEIIWKTNLLRVFDCGITPFSNSRFVAEFTNITRVNFVRSLLSFTVSNEMVLRSVQFVWWQFHSVCPHFTSIISCIYVSFFSHSLICYFIFQYLIGGRLFRTDIFDVGFYRCVCNKKSHACEVYSFGADARKCW